LPLAAAAVALTQQRQTIKMGMQEEAAAAAA
jgi:hypothetical protein